MVGFKLWGTTQKSQRANPNAKEDGAHDKPLRESENNVGKLKEMAPSPEEGSTRPSAISDEEDTNTPEMKQDQERKPSSDAKIPTELVNTEPGVPKVSKDETSQFTDAQGPDQVAEIQKENTSVVANENTTASSSNYQNTDDHQHTMQKIEEDKEPLHSHQAEPNDAAGDPQNQGPVLSEEDEQFLRQITTEVDIPPPLPARRATMIADDGELTEEEIAKEASRISLPATPKDEKSELSSQESATKPQTWKDRWSQWAVLPMPTSGLPFATPSLLRGYTHKRKGSSKATGENAQDANGKDGVLAAGVTRSVAEEEKPDLEEREPTSQQAAEKTTQDVSSILSSLNLSSINNRAVGISADTQKLLESFNTVLKDIINGGPRAYEDLEKLLSEREPQLDKLFGSLPPFLQSLVKSIPIKMYAALAPQLAAAMSLERSGAVASTSTVDTAETSDGEDVQTTTAKGKAQKKKSKSLIPSLRSLIGEKGAVAAMLKSILTFLEMRFPALAFLTGTNVLMSLSVFILLFVFWYCHKRGKETRLKRLTAASSATEAETSAATLKTGDQAPLTPFYPSLADLESGAIFEKQDFGTATAAAEEKTGVEEAVNVPLPDEITNASANGKVKLSDEEEREKKREMEMSLSDGKVAELIREAAGHA